MKGGVSACYRLQENCFCYPNHSEGYHSPILIPPLSWYSPFLAISPFPFLLKSNKKDYQRK